MGINVNVDLKPYNATGSFRFWCQKVLPLVYDDSLSYYELLCKVVNYLNDVIQNVDNLNYNFNELNKSYILLREYVNEYFNNLNVQEEINDKLDTMASDGTLDILLRGTDFLETMYIHPLGFYSNGLQTQGSTVVNIEGVNYLIVGFSASDENNDVILKINLSTGAIVNELVGNFGHCNGICCNDDIVYIARGGGNATNTNIINRIKFSTWELLDDIYTDKSIYAIDYRNNNFYCLSSVTLKNVYIYDSNFNLLNTINIEYVGANSWQGMCVDDDYIYISNFRGSAGNGVDGIGVYFYNGKLKSFVETPRNMEIEDISLYGNNFLATVYTGGGCLILSVELNQSVANVGRFRSKKPSAINTSDSSIHLYLDASYEGILQNGTVDKPFNNMTALIMSCLYDYFTTVTIDIKGDFSSTNITLPNISNIRNLTLKGVNGTLGSLYIGYGSMVYVNDITFVGEETSDDRQASISARGCILNVNNCVITNNHNGIYVESCKCTISNTVFNDCNTGIRGIRNSEIAVNTLTFNNVTTRTNFKSNVTNTNKIIYGFGDSIMYGIHSGISPVELIGNSLGWMSRSFGYSGAKYATSASTNLSLLHQLESANNSDFDCGIIICGTNDYLDGSGTGRAEATFRTFLSTAFDYINSAFADKPILVCTPFRRLNDDTVNNVGLKLEDYVNIILEIAESKSIMVYDCYHDTTMNFCNSEALSDDGLHPTLNGCERFINTLKNKLG